MSQFDNMVKFLDITYAMKDQLVPCMIGPVGIGKTEACLQHAKNVGAGKVVKITLSQVLPNEVSGMTMPDAKTCSMDIFDHKRLASLEDGDILFFDELLEADQMTLSACLTLIESREMISGRKLPDIQIVAATNPTIKAPQLKPSIRQRFLFKKFKIDVDGCHDYILDTCGLDVSKYVFNFVTGDGDDYNILSQRSLTKMCRWMASCSTLEEAERVAGEMNMIWPFALGDDLLRAWENARNASEKESLVRKTLSDMTSDLDLSVDFENDNLNDIMEVLMSLPDWTKLYEKLDNTMMTAL